MLHPIRKIQTIKQHLSLHQLPNIFSPTLSHISFINQHIIPKPIPSQPLVQLFIEQINKHAQFDFPDMLYVF
ncbi:DUF4004 family protein, partial [Bacillus mycoides]|uniref:DUF4004 family protein n=1 Tax=Bacillus mycoides TaxID=1405 RepID=UPI003CC7E7A0